jgi:hypothetical protein
MTKARPKIESKDESKAESTRRQITWTERRIDFLYWLEARFMARDYEPHVIESLVRTNKKEIVERERELESLRRVRI